MSEHASREHEIQTPREQYVYSLLRDRTSPVTLGELADWVNRWETSRFDYASRPQEDTHEELYEQVLPRLDSKGLLDFDVDRGLIRSVPAFSRPASRSVDG